MKKARQDAWTKDEDALLAEIVLQHINKGKTQLQAFKQAGEALSRTPAACGFRWNATIRKEYLDEIEIVKNNRKTKALENAQQMELDEEISIDSVIKLLEKVKATKSENEDNKHEMLLRELQEENQTLKFQMKRYREAWSEIGKVWDWVDKMNKAEQENEH